ncbi:ADP-ribosylation factor-binding protein GGA2-like isoform X2 [Genypterus blacodes]|uniref:ADP-ribosylation factor-binding protein GGA2-like isoform X2 n=1 Tax=Genypterus blacodes TaxID=154954 RepID=UPI003F7753F8
MATGDKPATLDSWLNQATDPANQEDRWDCIQGFYQLVNQEIDGPQVAIPLLVHKIQSPQEREALQALTVLEACMNNCGKRFHSEAAKFRFLNELIKVITPKYLGQWTPEKVKDRVTEILYGWTLWLKEEPKIQEAYGMLKKQGVVQKDPKLPDTVKRPPPPQRLTESVFDQEEKAKLLAKLLKSARPEDLETANRLIKSTMKEEQEKAERVSKRLSTLQEVHSSTKQLKDLIDQHTLTEAPLQPSDDLKASYERCDRLRPSLFRLASDTMDDDSALAEILAANDELTLVVNTYKGKVGRTECNGGQGRSRSEEEVGAENKAPTSPREIKSYHLIDLSALDSPRTHRKADSPLPSDTSPLPSTPTLPPSTLSPPTSNLESSFRPAANQEHELENRVTKCRQTLETPKSYYDKLIQGGGSGPLLRARGCAGSRTSFNGTHTWSLSQNQQFTAPSGSHTQPTEVSGSVVKMEESVCPPQSLTHIFVPMEEIRPSQLEPITLYDEGGVHVSLHFAKDSPAGHPSAAVMVISTVNTSAFSVKDFLFQAAVPKTMSMKLQSASGTHLHPYNPLLPPPALSQVLLLANPQRQKVRLRFKLTLRHGDQQLSEMGEIDNFPDWLTLNGL